jgi:diguanylate cyclase (GGDEF)-like protein
MLVDNGISPHLDVPTLSFAAMCLVAMLGVFLISAWLQQRSVRAFAWWGSAYLIGASSMALWSAPTQLFRLPPVIPAAFIFIACGMIWNGVRIFHGRRILGSAAFAGAFIWVIASQLLPVPPHGMARIGLGTLVVAGYTFAIAFELGRERRQTLYSKTAAIVVPCLHAGIFLLPLALRALLPDVSTAGWLTVFTLESMIYAVGTAFIMLLMVKDHHVHIYRDAANSDHLTGLLNRRAFQESALDLCARLARKREAVSVLMLDLDRFKSINDRFGHAVGDEVLRVFAQTIRTSMRAGDIVARFGGEEFAAIVPANLETAVRIAERIRASFQAAGIVIAGHAMSATVSIGVAEAQAPLFDLSGLLARADAALYRAKNNGRNRVHAADEEHASDTVRAITGARPEVEAFEELERRMAA